MRRLAAAITLYSLCAAGAGCGVQTVDPCAGVTGACLAVQIDPSRGVSAVDDLLLQVAGFPAQHPMHDGTLRALPVAVGLSFPTLPSGTNTIDLTVTGLRGGQAVGRAHDVTTLTPDQHETIHVQLTSSGTDLGVGDLAGSDLAGDLAGDLSTATGDGGAGSTPRQIAPLPGATVTQLRPTLHWVLGGGGGVPVVDLCKDPHCNTLLSGVTAHVNGDNLSAVPTVALPPGLVYWRVRIAASAMTTASATWPFWVPKHGASTAADSSSGALFDVNGDGYSDLVAGANDYSGSAGFVHVYLGAGNGSFTDVELSAPDAQVNGYFGQSVAVVGDVNGDGYSDFLVGELGDQGVGSTIGAAYLYLGSSNPSAADWGTSDRRIALDSPFGAGSAYGNVGSAGDVNGDGYSDFLVGASGAGAGGSGAAFLYLGGASPTQLDWNGTAPADRIALTAADGSSAFYGTSVSSVGDVDGDGYGDFVITALAADGDLGIAHVYLGKANPVAADWTGTTPKRIDLKGPFAAGGEFGVAAAPAGDVNGDGYSDFLVAASAAYGNAGAVRLFLGEPNPNVLDWGGGKKVDLTSPQSANAYFGDAVSGAGDVNGDGYADFLVGATGSAYAFFYLGEPSPAGADWNSPAASPSAAPTPAAKRIDLPGPGGLTSLYGTAVCGVDDIDGDGLDDFAISDPTASAQKGAVYIYRGASSPSRSQWTSSATVLLPSDTETGLGTAVALRRAPSGLMSHCRHHLLRRPKIPLSGRR